MAYHQEKRSWLRSNKSLMINLQILNALAKYLKIIVKAFDGNPQDLYTVFIFIRFGQHDIPAAF
jgi:hypothetical protein